MATCARVASPGHCCTRGTPAGSEYRVLGRSSHATREDPRPRWSSSVYSAREALKQEPASWSPQRGCGCCPAGNESCGTQPRPCPRAPVSPWLPRAAFARPAEQLWERPCDSEAPNACCPPLPGSSPESVQKWTSPWKQSAGRCSGASPSGAFQGGGWARGWGRMQGVIGGWDQKGEQVQQEGRKGAGGGWASRGDAEPHRVP